MNQNNINPNIFPGAEIQTPPSIYPPSINPEDVPGLEQIVEQTYIENLLRFNRGKVVTIYMTFTGSKEWLDKSFHGILEGAGRDNIVLSDPSTGKWYLLPSIYLDYIEFNEPITFGRNNPNARYSWHLVFFHI